MKKPFAILFFDNWYLASHSNLQRKLGKPKWIPEGTLVDPFLDVTWGYPTVYRDEASGKWRCLYQGIEHENGQRHLAAVAESNDGIEWYFPDLSTRIPHDGRRFAHQVLDLNNFLEWSTYFDPQTDKSDERLKGFVISKSDSVETPLYVSPDGISWKPLPRVKWHPEWADPLTAAFWNPYRQSYVVTTRPLHTDRRISLMETMDWRTFTQPELALQADALDTATAEIYGLPVFQYEHMFIGLVWLYHAPPFDYNNNYGHKFLHGKVDCQLGYSYNGWHFQRTLRESFMPNSEPGTPGSGSIYPTTMLVNDDNSIRIYSSSSTMEHGESRFRPNRHTGTILLHTLRLDGFTYFESRSGKGTLTTRPLLLHGGDLKINVQAPFGEVRVQVADLKGTPLEGYTFDDCKPLMGDELFWQPTWQEGRTVATLANQVLQLEIELTNARLYAIRGDFEPIVPHKVRHFQQTGAHPSVRPGF